MAEYFAGGHLRFIDGEWRDDNGDVVEIREVKRGKWIYDVRYYSCSICAGKRFNLSLGTDAEFCPYCGAKMNTQ